MELEVNNMFKLHLCSYSLIELQIQGHWTEQQSFINTVFPLSCPVVPFSFSTCDNFQILILYSVGKSRLNKLKQPAGDAVEVMNFLDLCLISQEHTYKSRLKLSSFSNMWISQFHREKKIQFSVFPNLVLSNFPMLSGVDGNYSPSYWKTIRVGNIIWRIFNEARHVFFLFCYFLG